MKAALAACPLCGQTVVAQVAADVRQDPALCPRTSPRLRRALVERALAHAATARVAIAATAAAAMATSEGAR